MNWLYDLVTNPFLITPVSSWLIAQVLKVIIHGIIYKKLSFERLFGDGGMPSGHSATVSSLAVMCALACGTGSVEFAIAAILAIIVCHDATGVRRETGKQAVLLNELIKAFEVLGEDKLPEVKLKEFVGHTPIQVIFGILIGVANAFIMYAVLL
ncbi:MAG: divergent PAP2 family protein [Ruminococcaceae bacterium]|nr:divergent PAP2 family protein [Oscillospiraceae bacterium]